MSHTRDDLRTRSEAARLSAGVAGRNGRERREDGADGHPLTQSKLGVCAGGIRGGSSVSRRRSRIKRAMRSHGHAD